MGSKYSVYIIPGKQGLTKPKEKKRLLGKDPLTLNIYRKKHTQATFINESHA